MFAHFKKQCMVALLAAGMIFGATTGAQAIDFKAKGQWLISFGLGDATLVGKGSNRREASTNDTFNAGQRVRLQLDAVASEALSGTVWFEMGSQTWGNSNQGASLGADGVVVKVKNAYLDWIVPETDLKFRMGLQAMVMPNAAGGTAILNADVASVVASYQFTDEVGLTAFWARPVNDNYTGWTDENNTTRRDANYLDNIDLFALTLPLTFDGVKATPWAMYGIMGKNALRTGNNRNAATYGTGIPSTADGVPAWSLLATYGTHAGNLQNLNTKNSTYSSIFFVGLPIKIDLWDPINVEFEANYGYVSGLGKYDMQKRGAEAVRADSKREGWLLKALVEYKMDWGIPGIFGWYASGDDGNVKNGSERMPTVAADGRFTSFLGAASTDWYVTSRGKWNEGAMSYAGTWGIGAHLRDMSFVEDLKHTLRVAYWGGTNSPSMTKYFTRGDGWNLSAANEQGPYLTTNDGLLELNLDSTYKIYDNLNVLLDLGYIVNMVDKGTWDRSWMNRNPKGYDKRDAWKAQLTFAYNF